MNVVVITILILGILGAVAAIILYFVAQKFKVFEDPRIDKVEEVLPAANCGGCGFPGCRAFAEAMVKTDDLSTLNCPVGGADTMKAAATILGREVSAADPLIAVLRCNGTCANRPKTNQYDGAVSCAIAASLYSGETACSYGCLGCGDCVEACGFDAIHMNAETGLPEVNDKCVACNACVVACPKNILELRKRGPKERRIFVSCVNKDKGGAARKACSAACIGCKKCEKECPFDAIVVENNLAYIDYKKCKLCRKCVGVCPTKAIHELNFPARKVETAPKAPVEKPVAKKTEANEAETKVEATKTEAKPESAKPTIENNVSSDNKNNKEE